MEKINSITFKNKKIHEFIETINCKAFFKVSLCSSKFDNMKFAFLAGFLYRFAINTGTEEDFILIEKIIGSKNIDLSAIDYKSKNMKIKDKILEINKYLKKPENNTLELANLIWENKKKFIDDEKISKWFSCIIIKYSNTFDLNNCQGRFETYSAPNSKLDNIRFVILMPYEDEAAFLGFCEVSEDLSAREKEFYDSYNTDVKLLSPPALKYDLSNPYIMSQFYDPIKPLGFKDMVQKIHEFIYQEIKDVASLLPPSEFVICKDINDFIYQSLIIFERTLQLLGALNLKLFPKESA